MKHLTKEQRYVISSLRKAGFTLQYIADELKVHKSTISRELQRNGTKRGKYNPQKAHEFASERKERFASNRAFTESIKRRICNYLEQQQWSPEQIVGYCRKHSLEMVSAERIYQFIRKNKENGGKLYEHLRHRLKHRKRPVGMQMKGKIKNRVGIDQRPEIINQRLEFGHWEADLIAGKNHKGFILRLTERLSKQLLMAYLPKGKNAKGVAQKMIDLLLPFKDKTHSITMDNGLEFAHHERVSKKLNAKTYFTNPYASWEKGQIEYMNKLIRQYYPKKKEINKSNTQNIKQIQMKLNNRPMKKINYEKPFELFYKFINQNVAFAS